MSHELGDFRRGGFTLDWGSRLAWQKRKPLRRTVRPLGGKTFRQR